METEGRNADGEFASRWISRGIEYLFEQIENRDREREDPDGDDDFDVVIVGSGYGGSISANALSRITIGGKALGICLLERGQEYLEGMFPSRFADLAGQVRFSSGTGSRPRGCREGLFDVRLGTDMCTVLANGLGGGSLINAGVLLRPDDCVLSDPRWPAPIRADARLADKFTEVEQRLLARRSGNSTIDSWYTPTAVHRPPPPKFDGMKDLTHGRCSSFEATPISVALSPGTATSAGVMRAACIGCGDCATGCNVGAKISLDVDLLRSAKDAGVEIFTGATVLRLKKRARGWIVEVQYTDQALRARQDSTLCIRAKHVILAAGTLGSTEILLRSRSGSFQLSEWIGRSFSGNGDMLATLWNTDRTLNGVADETMAPATRNVGPTITSIARFAGAGAGGPFIVEELSVPGAIRRAFEETFKTAQCFHDLAKADCSIHLDPGRDRPAKAIDPVAIDPEEIGRSVVIAVIGHDSADGRLELLDGNDPDPGDGALRIVWPQAKTDRRHQLRLSEIAASLLERGRRVVGTLLPNPAWRLLPSSLQALFSAEAGPLITVHPLGGCPMGDDALHGVVDHAGRVFDPALPTAGTGAAPPVHQGLAVLDGSIIPMSLGINPALTIATLASRAVEVLIESWFNESGRTQDSVGPPVKRPRYAPEADQERATRQPAVTRIELTERMYGNVEVDLAGAGPTRYVAEVTIRTQPVALRRWLENPARSLDLDESYSRLRLFLPEKRRRNDEASDTDATLIARLGGTMKVLVRDASSPPERVVASALPWLINRGLRDTFQLLCDEGLSLSPLQQVAGVVKLASRAGERRTIDYKLMILEVLGDHASDPSINGRLLGKELEGRKTLTYGRRANPWRQLATMSLTRFPGAKVVPPPRLTLDLPFLARIEVPLLRIVDQANAPEALADLGSLAALLSRLLVQIHFWSFRMPDTPPPRSIDRLPGIVPGLPKPRIQHLELRPPRPGIAPVLVRLTRYCPREGADPRRTPVLLLHGYSASGTTFAHPSVERGLAKRLHDRDRDVWIADLRTSAGMPTAKMSWAFEDAAYEDIPMAVESVVRETGHKKIDIVAHCMGSAMIWMALLGPARVSHPDPYLPQREALPGRIRKLVLSQVGPVTVFSAQNTLRAYLMRYARYFLPVNDYQFRVAGPPSFLDQLIDRILATLPYPDSEYDLENPFPEIWKRTPWVGTRHRMDALYGRDFSLENLQQPVLDAIDDHFGPLSLDTVSQAIHFASDRKITDRLGVSRFVEARRLRQRVRFPILGIHGRDNGLADVETAELLARVLKDGAPEFASQMSFVTIPNAGHQDCFIGNPRDMVFDRILEFLA
jgi:cholesterol oxidase